MENTENLRGLLQIIAADIVEHLDFDNIEIKNTTFIADDLRQQESDLIYLLPFCDAGDASDSIVGSATEVMIYILVEHQSKVDRTMGYRLLSYMCRIWESQRREYVEQNLSPGEWRFQPIIPIVFYTGDQRWETPPSLELLMDLPEALRRFIPQFDVLLLDVKRASDETLLRSNHPFGWLMTVLKQEIADESAFMAALDRLGEHLGRLSEPDEALWKQAIYYLYLLIFYKRSVREHQRLNEIVSENEESLRLSPEEESLMQSMAEYYLEQGMEKGFTEGKAEGFTEGKAEGKADGFTEAYRQWEAWNARRMEAEAKGEPFDEPPPKPPESSKRAR